MDSRYADIRNICIGAVSGLAVIGSMVGHFNLDYGGLTSQMLMLALIASQLCQSGGFPGIESKTRSSTFAQLVAI